MGLFEQLQDLMIKYHFRPEKKLSQFFCINEALLVFLANNAKIEKGDVVLEIGPGTGFLTKKLLDKAKKVGAKVVAIDAAQDMCELLTSEFATEIESGLLKIIFGDALEHDFEALGVNKIVALPPYHLSSDLVMKIALTKGLSKVLLVLDRGFVEKLTAFEGFSEYGALTAFVNLNAKVEVIEGGISQQSFFPPPNCVSAVVSFEFNPKNNSNEYYIFLREMFRHKNKDLSRALKQAFVFVSKELGWKEKEFNKKSQELKNTSRKVYSLAPDELLEVFEELSSSTKIPAKKTK